LDKEKAVKEKIASQKFYHLLMHNYIENNNVSFPLTPSGDLDLRDYGAFYTLAATHAFQFFLEDEKLK
jgi:hypothetical protein